MATGKSDKHKLRSVYDKSFCDITEYVQEIVDDQEHAELLTFNILDK